jgi:hypothetical protein
VSVADDRDWGPDGRPIFPIDPPDKPADFHLKDHTGDALEVSIMKEYTGGQKVYVSIAGAEDALCVALTVDEAIKVAHAIRDRAEYIHTLERRRAAGYGN